MKKAERLDRILRVLREQGEVEVAELAEALGVSNMTIRRDLDDLERQARIRRVHGGAVPALNRGFEPPFGVRRGHAHEAKRRIGKAAADLLETGEIVVLDTGTTTYEVAVALSSRHDLTVITPSLHIASLLGNAPGVQCITLGGLVRSGENATFGSLAHWCLTNYNADVCVLAVGGISAEGGITEFDPEAAALTRAQIERSRRVIVVADESKLGVITFAAVAETSAVDVLVTSASPDNPHVLDLEHAGLHVVNVPQSVADEEAGPALVDDLDVDAVT